jgi:hypothetical protein
VRKGFVGILILILFIGSIIGGYFYVKANPQTPDLILQKLNNIFKPTSDTEFISPLALARDQERREGVKSLSDTIFQYVTEHTGLLPTDFPLEETCIGNTAPCYNLASYLVPKYIDELPKDPQIGTDANTGFTTFKNSDGRVVVSIKGENGGEFEIIR